MSTTVVEPIPRGTLGSRVGRRLQDWAADNLLQQDFLRRSQFGTALEGLMVLVLGVAVTALVATTSTMSGMLASGIASSVPCPRPVSLCV